MFLEMNTLKARFYMLLIQTFMIYCLKIKLVDVTSAACHKIPSLTT